MTCEWFYMLADYVTLANLSGCMHSANSQTPRLFKVEGNQTHAA